MYPVKPGFTDEEDHGPFRTTAVYYPDHDVLAVGHPGLGHGDTHFGFMHQYGQARESQERPGHYDWSPMSNSRQQQLQAYTQSPGAGVEPGWYISDNDMNWPHSAAMLKRMQEAMPGMGVFTHQGTRLAMAWDDEPTDPNVMYHTAPASLRQQIMQNGLRHPSGDAIFAWDNLHNAERWRNNIYPDTLSEGDDPWGVVPTDVWEIRGHDGWEPDDYFAHGYEADKWHHNPNEDVSPDEAHPGAYHTYAVPPERLRLLKAAPGSAKTAATPSWWHLTENPKFALNPKYRPINNTTIGGSWPDPGLFVTRRPEEWYNGHDYVRPFVAEITGAEPRDLKGYSGEHFIHGDQLGQAEVGRVIPYQAYLGEQYDQTPYQGPDVREMTPEQVQGHLDAANDYIRANRAHMLSFPCSHCEAPNEQWNECQSCGQVEDRSRDRYLSRAYLPKFEGMGKFYAASSPFELPAEPGTTPIPANHVRLYHYTGAPEGVINREGLRMDRAKGESYGEPNRVWASAQKPNDSHRYAEFSMAHDDPRWDIGKYQDGINYGYPDRDDKTPEGWADLMQKRGSNVTFIGDIRPEEFIAVHEPWHRHVRYLIDNQIPLADVENIEEHMPGTAEARAVAEYRSWLEARGKRASFDVPWGYDAVRPEHGEVPPRVYHVAPRHQRQNISQHGLDASGQTWNTGAGAGDEWSADTGMITNMTGEEPDEYEWRPEGVYTFNGYPHAVEYANGDNDIWEVNTQHPAMQGNDPIRDPSIAHNWGADDYQGHVFTHVPREAIRLVDPAEHLAKTGMAWNFQTCPICQQPVDENNPGVCNNEEGHPEKYWAGPGQPEDLGSVQPRMYHGTRRDYREVILREGLRPSQPGHEIDQPRAIYLGTTPEEARQWAGKEGDVWEINVEGIQGYTDRYSYNVNGNDENYMTTEPIPPNRLRLTAYEEAPHWADKTAMAERSGDAQLDALIEKFTQENYHGAWPEQWMNQSGEALPESWGQPLPMERFRQKDLASGMCVHISEQFIAFLERHGVRARFRVLADSKHGLYPQFEQYNYGDREQGWPSHALVEVDMPSGTYTVDWTAAQYGYGEFPMVQRQQGQEWQREWTAGSETGEPLPDNGGGSSEPGAPSVAQPDNGVPPQVRETFANLAWAQRGEPEQAMLRLQKAYGGGVGAHAAEHIGDLTNRLTDWATKKHAGPDFSFEFVAPKVENMHNLLHSPYGFEREMDENHRSNADFYGKDEAAHRAEVAQAFQDYAEAHHALPVYNQAQWLGKQAATSLGDGRFRDTRWALDSLQRLVRGDRAAYHAAVADYRLGPDGQPMQYPWPEHVSKVAAPWNQLSDEWVQQMTQPGEPTQAFDPHTDMGERGWTPELRFTGSDRGDHYLLEAYTSDRNHLETRAGYVEVDLHSGEILDLRVLPQLQRQKVATEMFAELSRLGIEWRHSDNLSRDGEAFVGWHDPDHMAERNEKVGMADRSGIPEIDNLIDAFLKEPIADQADGWEPGFSAPTIDTLRDPQQAHGYCQTISEQFAEFAKQHGLEAYVTNTDVDEMGYKPTGPGGEIGFNENNEMEYGHYPEHTIVTIVLKDPDYPYGREFYVDFTASQYGYTDHPKVTSKVAMPVGPLPDNISYKLLGSPKLKQCLYADTPEFDKSRQHAAYLCWHEDGEIANVYVQPTLRRMGVASELLRRAREINPNVHHSEQLSEEAQGWSQAVGKVAADVVPNGGDLPFKPGDRVQLASNGEYGTVLRVEGPPTSPDYIPEQCEMCDEPTEGNVYEDGTCMNCGSPPHEYDPTTWLNVKLDSGQTVNVAESHVRFVGGIEGTPDRIPPSRETHPGPDSPEAIDGMVRNATYQDLPPGMSPAIQDSAEEMQHVIDSNRGEDLNGLPPGTTIPGVGPVTFHANRDLQRVADEYMHEAEIPYHPPRNYRLVDPGEAGAVAKAYDFVQHDPNDPHVRASYEAFKKETLAQYKSLVKNGYRMHFYPEYNPYPNSPREATYDLHKNKHIYNYPTVGLPGEQIANPFPADHPMLEDSGVRWGSRPVNYNDLFRGVHDVFGHAKEGVGFRWHGEDNAWRQHAAMYTPLARGAMSTETRGQNCWVNFGPHGEANQTANQETTVYPEQKAIVMPPWALHIGDDDAHPPMRIGAIQPDPERAKLEQFFDEAQHGQHAPQAPIQWQPGQVSDAISRHGGPFDQHIFHSIPGYRDNMERKVNSLLQTVPRGRLLDIAGGEGSFGKSLSELSNGQLATVNLEPHPDFAAHFQQSEVPGASSVPQAFHEGFVDSQGNTVPRYQPDQPFDVIHEAMGFQFIGPNRDGQIQEAKRMLKPGGLFLAEEKLFTPNFDANEQAKDEWKLQHFNQGQLDQKNEQVGFQPTSMAMTDNMVSQGDLEHTLAKHFACVERYWESGNFMGYACSDDPAIVRRFIGSMSGNPRLASDLEDRIRQFNIERQRNVEERRRQQQEWENSSDYEPYNPNEDGPRDWFNEPRHWEQPEDVTFDPFAAQDDPTTLKHSREYKWSYHPKHGLLFWGTDSPDGSPRHNDVIRRFWLNRGPEQAHEPTGYYDEQNEDAIRRTALHGAVTVQPTQWGDPKDPRDYWGSREPTAYRARISPWRNFSSRGYSEQEMPQFLKDRLVEEIHKREEKVHGLPGEILLDDNRTHYQPCYYCNGTGQNERREFMGEGHRTSPCRPCGGTGQTPVHEPFTEQLHRSVNAAGDEPVEADGNEIA